MERRLALLPHSIEPSTEQDEPIRIAPITLQLLLTRRYERSDIELPRVAKLTMDRSPPRRENARRENLLPSIRLSSTDIPPPTLNEPVMDAPEPMEAQDLSDSD